jgi:hypothetical protein
MPIGRVDEYPRGPGAGRTPIGAREKPLAGAANERGAETLWPEDPPCGMARCASAGKASAATIAAIAARRFMQGILRLFQ